MSRVNESLPLVSVGIPTYNRKEMLLRAVESVLAQDYPNLEVVISDNASTDGTQALCEQLCQRDGRVRYIKQPVNIGANANFAEVFTQSQGDLYMVLGDDDWLNSNYVSHCAQALLVDPSLAAVCGMPRMFRGQIFLRDGGRDDAPQGSGGQRMVAFYTHVGENAAIHALMRREVLLSVPPMQSLLAHDWLFIAAVAFIGKIKTLDSTSINIAVTGTTGDWVRITRHLRLPLYQAYFPYPIIIYNAFKDIAWVSPVYESMGRYGRTFLAFRTAIALGRKFILWSAAVVAKRLWCYFSGQPFPFHAG